jgi:hypothetical protein
MFEMFKPKQEAKTEPKTESKLMGDRIRMENEALIRAEKHYLHTPTEDEVQAELIEEAQKEDEERRKAA